jgi:multiple sugar transport system ATP-binding protein
MPRIVLENITKRWGGFTAVENLNLVIEDGDFIILLGPSGCGKTTTLRMIAGLETPTEGRITIDSVPVFDSEKGINVPASRRDVGFLFQNYALWPHMTVRQNIAFGLENMKWKKEAIEARVQEMLKKLKIEEFIDRYPSELSGGQQQRVAIARTLAPKPRILFMDEPLSNLDAKLRSEMRIELKRLHKDLKSTFVYVTHDQLEAMTLASKVCLMKDGLLQQFDPPLKTYTSPCNLFVADFVGNPTMNFVKASFFRRDGSRIFISLLGHECEFVANEPMAEVPPSLIVGIRPEYIEISDIGKLEGIAYSTLPSGMETTIKVKIGDAIVSSVVFGAIDFPPDQPVRCSIIGSSIILFDESTGFRAASGSLKL